MANDNETVKQVCKEIQAVKKGQHVNGGRLYERYMMKCQIAEEYAGRIIAAHNREITAKDAEIESFKDENARLRVIVSGATVAEGNLREEIERLCALVKEMLSHIEELYQCQSPCDSRCLRKKESCEFRARRELIVKAREVVK